MSIEPKLISAAQCKHLPDTFRCTHILSPSEETRSFEMHSPARKSYLDRMCALLHFPLVLNDFGKSRSSCFPEPNRHLHPSWIEFLDVWHLRHPAERLFNLDRPGQDRSIAEIGRHALSFSQVWEGGSSGTNHS